MIQYFKKVTLAGMTGLMAFSVFTFTNFNVKAAETESSAVSKNEQIANEVLEQADTVLASYDNLTPEQKALYDKAMSIEIAKHQNEAGFNEEVFKNSVNAFVFEDEGQNLKMQMARQGMQRWKYTGVWLTNSVVASGINLATCLLTGGAGTVGIKMLVKKVGTKAAINALEKAIKNKLIWFGLKQVSGITPIISTIVRNVLDPGTAIAKWYDSKDIRPNNGHCDIA